MEEAPVVCLRFVCHVTRAAQASRQHALHATLLNDWPFILNVFNAEKLRTRLIVTVHLVIIYVPSYKAGFPRHSCFY